MSAPPLRFGIIGHADIVRRKFLPALKICGEAELHLLGSRCPMAVDDNLPAATYEEVLANPDVDLVYIPLPNHLHEEWTIRALRAGKHVICEKPLGLSPDSIRRMIAAARETGRLLYENIMYLHHPQHQLVRNLVQTGTIGPIRQMRANFCFTQTRADDFRLHPAQGGGSFHDQSRYPITAALCHLQGKLGVFHGVARYRNGLDVAVSGSALSSANELFTFTIAFDQPYEAFYELIGELGSIRIDRPFTTPPDLENSIKIRIGDQEEVRPVPAADHFQLMIEHVCRLIRAGDFESELRAIEERAVLIEKMRQGCLGDHHD